jgi:hypothetical protein
MYPAGSANQQYANPRYPDVSSETNDTEIDNMATRPVVP